MSEEVDLTQFFGITEEQYDTIWKQVEHAKIETDDLMELCKLLFPDSKENQVKAALLTMSFDEGEE